MENSKTKIGIYDECYNPVIFSSVKKNSKCLDVGCWTGNTGKHLIEKKNCQVDGIDINAEALEEAKKKGYKMIFIINLNDDDFKLEISEKYDFIICADVLEHLREPEMVLKKLKNLLKTDGQILISVPNIAFIQPRIELALGRFNYDPRGGIMDASHLRFFTINSMRKMCVRAGFKIFDCFGYSEVRGRYFFLRPLSKVWPSLFAVQIFVKITHAKK